jgi:RNA polymerase sigma-70 factor (ECF subfamily)
MAPPGALTVSRRDAELVAETLSGNRAAFAQLIRDHIRWVGAVAAGVLGDLGAARDVACESFRRAFVSLAKLPDRERFRPWLYTITQRTALDWLRHYLEAQETSALGVVSAAEPSQAQQVLAEILALPPHFREAILLRHLAGCSCSDVADLMGGEVADAETLLGRAELALALRLKP